MTRFELVTSKVLSFRIVGKLRKLYIIKHSENFTSSNTKTTLLVLPWGRDHSLGPFATSGLRVNSN